jgi:hypothetical protein
MVHGCAILPFLVVFFWFLASTVGLVADFDVSTCMRSYTYTVRRLLRALQQALPPTFEAHLSGLPGFTAEVDYTVTAVASKTKNARLGIGATCVSSLSPSPCSLEPAMLTRGARARNTGPSRRRSYSPRAGGPQGGYPRAWSRRKSAPAWSCPLIGACKRPRSRRACQDPHQKVLFARCISPPPPLYRRSLHTAYER